jgi:hypothetical protein|tara:strand:+ start:270 stop:461 length:192 start_codon:yes stop_codon:yes gene_type:complete
MIRHLPLTLRSAVGNSWRLFGQRSDAEKMPTVTNPLERLVICLIYNAFIPTNAHFTNAYLFRI